MPVSPVLDLTISTEVGEVPSPQSLEESKKAATILYLKQLGVTETAVLLNEAFDEDDLESLSEDLNF